MIQIKKLICNSLQDIIDQKIELSKSAIQSAKESRDNDTKSSMGDKYETGRAMIQMELEKYQLQLSHALKFKNQLSEIKLEKECTKVEFGSIVFTNNANYFISFAMGKINIENIGFYCISLASPIGKFLFDKKVGDKLLFQEKEYIILDIK